MNTKYSSEFTEKINLRGTNIKKWNYYPEDVIPMWVADTDFKSPEPVVDALRKRVEIGAYGYPTVTDSFNNAAKNWMKKRFNWEIENDWVNYVNAVVPGIVNAILSFTSPGDKVLINSPVYHPFQSIIENCGRIKVTSSLICKDGEWDLDFNDMEEKLKDSRMKLFILCNPHNPVGRVYSKDELMKIGNMCLKNNAVVVSDEIHSDIIYNGYKHIPFPSLSEEIKENSLIFINPSKTFNIPGLRTGAAIIPNKKLRDDFHNTLVANRAENRNVFGSIAFETAYNECDYYADQLADYVQNNFLLLQKYFEEHIPKIKVTKAQATYLIWLDCSSLGLSPNGLADFMLNKAKVAMNSGSAFGEEGNQYMRINIGCHRDTLEEALKRIADAVNSEGL